MPPRTGRRPSGRRPFLAFDSVAPGLPCSCRQAARADGTPPPRMPDRPVPSPPPSSMSESTVDPRSLWARTASGDDLARDEILRENLNLVHHVARQLSRSLAVAAD